MERTVERDGGRRRWERAFLKMGLTSSVRQRQDCGFTIGGEGFCRFLQPQPFDRPRTSWEESLHVPPWSPPCGLTSTSHNGRFSPPPSNHSNLCPARLQLSAATNILPSSAAAVVPRPTITECLTNFFHTARIVPFHPRILSTKPAAETTTTSTFSCSSRILFLGPFFVPTTP